ncbi:MAG TPA: DUF6603 domain-containing protein [Polyangia bacterium]|jgi:hypothetical protein
MAANAGTLETIARHLAQALQPLEDILGADNVLTTLGELGVQFPPQLLQPAFVTAIDSCAAAAGGLSPLVTELITAIEAGDDLGLVTTGLALLQQLGKTVDSFAQVSAALGALSGSLPGVDAAEVTAFATALPSKLLGYLIVSYLEENQPPLLGAANLLGIVDYLPSPGVPGDPAHPPFITRQLQLGRLGDVLTKPADSLRALYHWGDPAFTGIELIQRLNASLDLLGIPSELVSPTALQASLFTLQANPTGLTATLTDRFASDFDLTLPLTSLWSLQIHMAGTFATGIAATIKPVADVSLAPPPPGAALTGELRTSVIAKRADAAHPIVVLGQTGGSRLQADSFSFGVGMTVKWDAASSRASAEPELRADIVGGRAVIDMSNADGFLATVLSGAHVEAPFTCSLVWQPESGIHFEGGAQLEIDLPLHLDLGPVSLPTLYLVAGASSDGIPLELSAALAFSLGPIAVAIDRVGVKGLLSFPDHGGNLGPANLSATFKPPTGLGLAIDAGVAAGGGFIGFDPDRGQYSGTFDLELAGIVQIKVIGILDTHLPDGSAGYSFLLILTFALPPIQLGFGFTLNGVGGLIGVNRTMAIDALHAGLRAHTLDSILFPPDPIKNAPQIISNLRSFFPPAQGRYVFGPMLELGWGTPTLITLALGVVLEVPDPVRLAIIGLIDVALPTADTALIALHIDVLGTVDFGAKKLSIDGSLYDSRVLIYSLSGDLAMRLSWGSAPSFLFSLGGFNPHFDTTALDIPQLDRMSISIGDGDNPRISSNSYLAITSNTLQFGANTEAYASAAGFGIHGYLGFDVLIVYSPFSFEFDFTASFDVSFEGHSLCGLDVDGTFSGPRPWHLHAHASIHILWWSVGASLTLEWGDSTPAILPLRAVLGDLLPALEDARNWSAALPSGTTQAVTLASRKADDKALRVHPMGTLTVREVVVPLDLPITRYGNAAPSDGTLFALAGVSVNGHATDKTDFADYFAAAQFLTLSDADKLGRPSFERYHAGIEIGSAAVTAGADAARTIFYEERYLDVPDGFSRFTRKVALSADLHAALTQQGAGFRSPVKNSGLLKYQTSAVVAAPPAVIATGPTYVVAGVDDLAVRPDIVSHGGVSFFQARAALATHLAAHPEEAADLQIVPLHEVAA